MRFEQPPPGQRPMFSLGFKEGLQGVLTCDKALQMSVQDVRGYFSYDFQQCLYEACSLV